MAFIQKNVPPPNKVLTFTMQNFVGGLNNRSYQMEANEASDILNMQFDDETVMSKRPGMEHWNATTYDGQVSWIDYYAPYSEPAQLVVATPTNVYINDVISHNTTGPIQGVNYMGKYWWVDGRYIFCYGKFPQTNDTYTQTWGTVNPNYVRLRLVDPPAGYTPLGTSHVQGKWVYSYDAGEMWYEPCENEIKDTYKGGNKVPHGAKYIAVHGDRLYLAGVANDASNVFISDISNGLYFPVYLPIGLPPNGDEIRGMITYHDSVVVGRKNDIHVIYGNTNRPDVESLLYQLKKVTSHTGFASYRAVDIVNNYLFFLGYDGVAYMMHTTKTDVDLLATSILTKTVDLYKAPINADAADFASAHSVYFKDEWHLALNDLVLVYSYRHQAFTLYQYAGFSVKSFYIKDYDLLHGASNGRILKRSETTYSDLGKPYLALWKSRLMDMGEPTTFKQFREFYTVAHTYDEFVSRVEVRFEVDYVDINEAYTLTNMSSIYGRARWGDRFINRNIVESLPVIIGRRGRTFRFLFTNGHYLSGEVATPAGLEGFPGLKEGTLVYVQSENKYYLFTEMEWVEQDADDLFQPMKIYEVSGQYELRGKR